MGQIKTALNKKVGAIQGEVANVSSKLGTLDDKINELQGSQQKLPRIRDLENAFRNIV